MGIFFGVNYWQAFVPYFSGRTVNSVANGVLSALPDALRNIRKNGTFWIESLSYFSLSHFLFFLWITHIINGVETLCGQLYYI